MQKQYSCVEMIGFRQPQKSYPPKWFFQQSCREKYTFDIKVHMIIKSKGVILLLLIISLFFHLAKSKISKSQLCSFPFFLRFKLFFHLIDACTMFLK